MTAAIVALGAFGLVLMYSAFTQPIASRSRVTFLTRFARSLGVTLSGGQMLLAMILTWALGFVLVAGVSASLIVAATLATALVWVPVTFIRARVSRRRRELSEAWPDAIATLIAGVRAGVSLPEACIGLVARGPKELRAGFEAFAATFRASGSFPAALERLRDVLDDPTADRVCVSLGLAHEVGGTDLVRVLRAIGDFMREDLRVRMEVEARWSWTVTAARVAAAAPWAVLLMMSTRPEASRAYDTAAGATVIAVGAAATFIGYRLMLRAARLPEDPRLPR